MISMNEDEKRALDRERTKNATAKLNRQREAKAADLLLERGWKHLVTPQGKVWPDPQYVDGDPPKKA
jgi:hypothetical protein